MIKFLRSIVTFVISKVTKLFAQLGFNTSINSLIPDTRQAFKKYNEDRNLEHDETGHEPSHTLVFEIIKIWNLHVFSLIIVGATSIYLLYKYGIILVIGGYIGYELFEKIKQDKLIDQQQTTQNQLNAYIVTRSVVFDAVLRLKDFLPIVIPHNETQISASVPFSMYHKVSLMYFIVLKKISDLTAEEALTFAKHQFQMFLIDAQNAYELKFGNFETFYSESQRSLETLTIEDKGSYYLITVANVCNPETYRFICDQSNHSRPHSIQPDSSDTDF